MVAAMRDAISWWSSTLRTPPAPAASQTITSDWIQARLYPVEAGATTIPVYHDRMRARAIAWTDAASGVNGLRIEQSNDDAAAKNVHDRTQIVVPAGGNGTALEVLVTCKYVRYSYQAGAVAPTAATFTLRGELVDG